ncbi:hypothetical protein BGY98DRAFT_743995 [Russula aff. rugulosa BPL654]|nr:hypothetical protein BGY98DRAFT_743995 [Russula aff. rugulosa BPL654]
MQPPPLSPGGTPSESTGIEGSDAVSGSEKVVSCELVCSFSAWELLDGVSFASLLYALWWTSHKTFCKDDNRGEMR